MSESIDIQWIIEKAEHKMKQIDQLGNEAKEYIVDHTHLYWMIYALKEISKKISEMESEI